MGYRDGENAKGINEGFEDLNCQLVNRKYPKYNSNISLKSSIICWFNSAKAKMLPYPYKPHPMDKEHGIDNSKGWLACHPGESFNANGYTDADTDNIAGRGTFITAFGDKARWRPAGHMGEEVTWSFIMQNLLNSNTL